MDVSSTFEDGQLSFIDEVITSTGLKSFDQMRNPQTQLEIYEAYVKNFMASQKKNRKSDNPNQLSLFDIAPEVMQTGETPGPQSTGTDTVSTTPDTQSGKRPMTQEEFAKTVTEYSAKAISVPKILVQTTSEVKFNHFEVKRTIQDFEIATAKIERFDAINQHLLTVVDAQALEVEDARNTLACMLLDSISELSYDDADFIIDVVEQYLSQIPGDEEEKKKIVRRYAGLIVNDIKNRLSHTWTERRRTSI